MSKENTVDSIPTSVPDKYHQEFELFLKKNGWNEKICPTCDQCFYAKKIQQGCGDSTCSGNFEFLDDDRKEKTISLHDTNVAFRNYFLENGFSSHSAKSILNENGTTLFTSAGVQVLDNCILRNGEAPTDSIIVSQPSLRTQYADSIGEGNSLSFVNICTETANATPEVHFQNLDKWLGFLSKLGVYVGDLTLHKRNLVQKWGEMTVQSDIVAIFYKGLEIGDGNYNYGFNPEPSSIKTVSDFGFGLERLTWILRKGSYFDAIGPLTESLNGDNKVQEIVKTVALLASSGLTPSNKDKGYRFRLFTKKLVELSFPKHLQLSHLIDHYHKYWNDFVNLPVESNSASESVQGEYDRNYNLQLNKVLLTNVDANCNTEQFLLNLLSSGVKRDDIGHIYK